MQRRDAWIYADMTMEELHQRRDALQSLVINTTGLKHRRYLSELQYVDSLIYTDSLQLTIKGILDTLT